MQPLHPHHHRDKQKERHDKSKRDQKEVRPRLTADQSEAEKIVASQKVAYATVISNNEYVDGALVLGHSLLQCSPFIQKSLADFIILLPPGRIHPENQIRLQKVGWKIWPIMDSLSENAPASTWKDTFDKLYIWSLVEYAKVAFFDADMLCLKNPDGVFSFRLEKNWIGAIGARDGKYFHTGMMLLLPSSERFADFKNQLVSGGVNGSGVYNNQNARDGKMIREFFQDRYINIDPHFSAYRSPEHSLEGIFLFHYKWKPWNDWKVVPPQKYGVNQIEFGPAYSSWWKLYEDMHRKLEASWTHGSPWFKNFTPDQTMWLKRHSSSEWTQPVTREIKAPPGFTKFLGGSGESCTAVCTKQNSVCIDQNLLVQEVNSCESLQLVSGCRKCEEFQSQPFSPCVAGSVCFINFNHNATTPVSCASQSQRYSRYCLCTPIKPEIV